MKKSSRERTFLIFNYSVDEASKTVWIIAVINGKHNQLSALREIHQNDLKNLTFL